MQQESQNFTYGERTSSEVQAAVKLLREQYSLGQTIDKNQYLDILDRAEALRDLSQGKRRSELEKELEEELGITDQVPLSALYQASLVHEIPSHFLNRAIEISTYPVEDQWKDIALVNGKVSPGIAEKIYNTELLKKLKEYYPIFEFELDGLSIYQIFRGKKTVQKGFFRKRSIEVDVTQKREWVYVDPNYSEMEIRVYDIRFLKACKDELEKFEKYVNRKNRITIYDKNLQIPEDK